MCRHGLCRHVQYADTSLVLGEQTSDVKRGQNLEAEAEANF